MVVEVLVEVGLVVAEAVGLDGLEGSHHGDGVDDGLRGNGVSSSFVSRAPSLLPLCCRCEVLSAGSPQRQSQDRLG